MARDPRPWWLVSVGAGVVTGHQTGPDRPGAVDGDPDHRSPRSAHAADPGIRPAGRVPVAYRDYSTKHPCQCHSMNLASAPCSEDGRHISARDTTLPGRARWREPTRSEGGRVSLPSSRDLLDYAHCCDRLIGQAGRSPVKSTDRLWAYSRRRNTVATRSSRDPPSASHPSRRAFGHGRLRTASASPCSPRRATTC